MSEITEEKYIELLESGEFFNIYPNLSGVWSQDKEKLKYHFKPSINEMEVKDAVVVAPFASITTRVRPQGMNKDTEPRLQRSGNISFTDRSAEFKNKAESLERVINKSRSLQLIRDSIESQINLYNLNAPKGLKINLQDVINELVRDKPTFKINLQ